MENIAAEKTFKGVCVYLACYTAVSATASSTTRKKSNVEMSTLVRRHVRVREVAHGYKLRYEPIQDSIAVARNSCSRKIVTAVVNFCVLCVGGWWTAQLLNGCCRLIAMV